LFFEPARLRNKGSMLPSVLNCDGNMNAERGLPIDTTLRKRSLYLYR
jgi:hypothetical protein